MLVFRGGDLYKCKLHYKVDKNRMTCATISILVDFFVYFFPLVIMFSLLSDLTSFCCEVNLLESLFDYIVVFKFSVQVINIVLIIINGDKNAWKKSMD